MEQVAKLKRTWNLPPVLQIVQKIHENYCPCLYLSIGQVWSLVVQKIYSKMHPVSCTNTHHDVTDLVNLGMVKNTKTWISWERNTTFPRNKKILNLRIRWCILSEKLKRKIVKIFSKCKRNNTFIKIVQLIQYKFVLQVYTTNLYYKF